MGKRIPGEHTTINELFESFGTITALHLLFLDNMYHFKTPKFNKEIKLALTNQELLNQLEFEFIKGILSIPDYNRKKTRVIRDAYSNKELLKPVISYTQENEILDSKMTSFCYIPPGPFIFGVKNEITTIQSGFYLAKYPVTVDQFLQFIESSNWNYPKEDLDLLRQLSPTSNCPASNVSWRDGKGYCRWLRKVTNEYYSLPYEKEWEYAARGIDGRKYPWGHQLPTPNFMNFHNKKSSSNSCFLGGRFSNYKSPFGIMDMVGNIDEWCLDELEESEESIRILRGGSCLQSNKDPSCLQRTLFHSHSKRVRFGGFRVLYLPGMMYNEYKNQIFSSNPEVLEQLGLKKI